MNDRSAVEIRQGNEWASYMGVYALIGGLFFIALAPAEAQLTYVGVNLTGAEYGADTLPGQVGTDYIYPTSSEVDYFMATGMNTFRVPFSWERMQPIAGGALDGAQLSLMDGFVNDATSKGANVILDPHNFAAYYGEVIGAAESSVTIADFSSLWSQLATHYKDNSHVIFGLMNEPVGIDESGGRPGGTTEQWLASAQAAINAIRATNAANLILVPGNGYTGAGSWDSTFYGTSNSNVMGAISDTNFAYEVHLYFDADASGTSDTIYQDNSGIGVQRLVDFTDWLEANNARGFLGEFGASSGMLQDQTLDLTLDYLDTHSSDWLGWTYWAAGPWDVDSFSIDPNAPGDKSQLGVLEEHMAAVPEPGAVWLVLAGLSLFAIPRLRRQHAATD